ncbi:ECF-type sigma factor [Cytophagales bacterium LB-30]|uniref:ECF-type sigma factor n=1 Tax=Shiella aurantiaca TaxID=3058365 RepID=A0ABT8F973_9BACT|nr:ECF-type sigma factor [Shiella aurantiaca]MDN4166995.1 ECF-type sigma factor [Shiella aurantiaca]
MQSTLHPSELTQRILTFKDMPSKEAFDEIFPYLYQELKRLAHKIRAQHKGHDTLNTTAIVHELYEKLASQQHIGWENRLHFTRVAGKAIRHILINNALAKNTEKRGGNRQPIDLEYAEQILPLSEHQCERLLDLHEALSRLEAIDQQQGQIVECRFFSGMTIEETAQALQLSEATVKRHWTLARTWLFQQLKATA